MLFLALACSLLAFAATGLLSRYARRQGLSYPEAMPQRFHRGAVPRVGGFAILVTVTLAWAWLVLATSHGWPTPARLESGAAATLWLAVMLPAAVGVWEDVTQRVSARRRLLLTILPAIAAVTVFASMPWVFGQATMPVPDHAARWAMALAAVLFMGGMPHAFNLIDGYNGQAGMAALICSLGLAIVAHALDDRLVAALALSLTGATAGFLVWNYPRGLIFAGDGGAYLWGATLSATSLLLVVRHAEVSPLFPVALLLYPIQETAFSALRRLARGRHPTTADALHLHHLIFRRLARAGPTGDEARRVLMRNNRTSPYLWGFTLLTVLPAVLFWNQTGLLLLCIVGFIVVYVWSYSSIVRFKLQRWVRR